MTRTPAPVPALTVPALTVPTLTVPPVPTTRRRRAARGAAALLAALTLVACSGGNSDSSSGSSGAGASSDQAAGGRAATQGAALAAGSVAGSAADSAARSTQQLTAKAAALEPRRQVRTGDLAVRVRDVDAAVARVRSLAVSADGYVGDERTVTDPGQPGAGASRAGSGTSSQLTLRVPEANLDAVMTQVAGLGTLLSRSTSSTDVSGTYVDTQARLQTQRESVARVRALLGRATTIGQVVQVEGQLAGRTAELEALEARLANLDDQTTLATLKVSLTPPVAAATAATVQDATFLSGLRGGWHALGAGVSAALVVLGAVLPFAAVAAVVGVPVWLARRRRVRAAASA